MGSGRVRARIAAEHGNDLRRIVEDLKRRQAASGRKIVSLEPRRPRKVKGVPKTSGR